MLFTMIYLAVRLIIAGAMSKLDEITTNQPTGRHHHGNVKPVKNGWKPEQMPGYYYRVRSAAIRSCYPYVWKAYS